jgi:hypothetical protein
VPIGSSAYKKPEASYLPGFLGFSAEPTGSLITFRGFFLQNRKKYRAYNETLLKGRTMLTSTVRFTQQIVVAYVGYNLLMGAGRMSLKLGRSVFSR